MGDYVLLINALRHCAVSDRSGCAANCKFGQEHPFGYACMDYMFKDAADAIEELQSELFSSRSRLADYEDTGLEPEEVAAAMKDGTYQQFQEWNRAHYEGRLVVLPCKVVDTVYQKDNLRDFDTLLKDLLCCNTSTACDGCSRFCDSDRCDNLGNEAAEAIKELLAAVPHWISVEERLPEPEQGVLVFDDCEYMNVGCYTHDKYFPTLFEFHVNGEYEPGITHWMPLPEQPKEETD